jgi:hypothetical protein
MPSSSEALQSKSTSFGLQRYSHLHRNIHDSLQIDRVRRLEPAKGPVSISYNPLPVYCLINWVCLCCSSKISGFHHDVVEAFAVLEFNALRSHVYLVTDFSNRYAVPKQATKLHHVTIQDNDISDEMLLRETVTQFQNRSGGVSSTTTSGLQPSQKFWEILNCF